MRKRVRRKIVKRAIEKIEKRENLTHQEAKILGRELARAYIHIRVAFNQFIEDFREAFHVLGETVGNLFQRTEVRQLDRSSSD